MFGDHVEENRNRTTAQDILIDRIECRFRQHMRVNEQKNVDLFRYDRCVGRDLFYRKIVAEPFDQETRQPPQRGIAEQPKSVDDAKRRLGRARQPQHHPRQLIFEERFTCRRERLHDLDLVERVRSDQAEIALLAGAAQIEADKIVGDRVGLFLRERYRVDHFVTHQAAGQVLIGPQQLDHAVGINADTRRVFDEGAR